MPFSVTVNQVTATNTAQTVRPNKKKTLKGAFGLPWPSAIAGMSPTAWYRMATAGVGGMNLDSSGNGHTMPNYQTLPTLVTGINQGDPGNGAGSFNGSTDWMADATNGTSWANTNAVTLACIIKTTGTPASSTNSEWPLIDKDYLPAQSSYSHYTLKLDSNGKVFFRFWNTGGTPFTALSTTTVNDGQPHLIIGRYNPATNHVRIYVDSDVPQATATLTGTPRSAVGSMYPAIGSNTYSQAVFYAGVMDEAIIWDSSISDANLTALVNAYLGQTQEQDTAQRIARTRFFTVNQVTGTNTAQPMRPTRRMQGDTLFELDTAQPITVGTPPNGSFANRTDISEEFWALPTVDLLKANTEAGEYTSGLTATIWWQWTCPTIGTPYSVTWSFPWAGQSGAGGGSIRVYSPATAVLPSSGDIDVQHNPTGASGTATVTLTPVAGTTYYIQQGIREKAGTVGHFDMAIAWAAPEPPFTPVVPWP